MKVLVIGGTRYFGKRLVHLLLEKKHEVWVLSRGKSSPDFPASVHRLTGDRTQLASMKEAMGSLNFDVVVDQVCMKPQDAEIAIEVLKDKTPFYVMTSTLSVYPFQKNMKEEVVDPLAYQAKPARDPNEEYAEGKRGAEAMFATKAPFKVSFARFPIVVGEDDFTKRLYSQVEKIKKGESIYFPNLQAEMCMITSTDAARSLLWLAENKKQGAYNFCSADSIPLGTLVQQIEDIVGKKANLDKTYNNNWSAIGIPEHWTMNTEKAQREGFKIQPLKEWMPKLLKHFANEVRVLEESK